jgi:hypothetical protein
MNAEIYVSKSPCRHNPDVFLAVDANEIIVLHRDGVEDEVLEKYAVIDEAIRRLKVKREE